MHQLQQSWVRSQHPSAQWNLRGGRWSSVEYSTKTNKKSPKKYWEDSLLHWCFYNLYWHSAIWLTAAMYCRWYITYLHYCIRYSCMIQVPQLHSVQDIWGTSNWWGTMQLSACRRYWDVSGYVLNFVHLYKEIHVLDHLDTYLVPSYSPLHIVPVNTDYFATLLA